MTDLDFLDEAGPATPQSTESVNAEPAQDATTAPENTVITPGPDTEVSAPEAEDKPKFTLITASYPEGTEVPEGYKTVSEFAGDLSVRNVLADPSKGAANLVDKTTIAAAIKAVRNPLPVIVIGETPYLGPDAVTAWDVRPVRGEGTGGTAGGTLADEELFRLSDKVRNTVTKLEERLASVTERLNKAKATKAKRDAQLSARGKTWDDVDNWAAAQEETMPDENAENTEETPNE